jgi:hypothetical protein
VLISTPSRRRRVLQQLVRSENFCERQTLGHDRVDLALTEQLKQRLEVFPEPVRVAVAQLVDAELEGPPGLAAPYRLTTGRYLPIIECR